MNNKEIKAEIKYLLNKEGKSMTWLAEQLDTTPQKLNSKFTGKSMAINKLEELLKPIGYKVDIRFVKEDETHE